MSAKQEAPSTPSSRLETIEKHFLAPVKGNAMWAAYAWIFNRQRGPDADDPSDKGLRFRKQTMRLYNQRFGGKVPAIIGNLEVRGISISETVCTGDEENND